MKLRAIIGFVFIMVAGLTYAQTNMGIKGGLNFSTIHPEGFSNPGLRTGFHAGLLWHIHMAQGIAFQPELLYSLQGARLSNNEKLNLGYINAPFLLQVMVGRGFRLEAGPQLGLLVNARTQSGNTLENVRPGYKTIDAALAVGFGFLGRAGLGFDARYNYGLSAINKSGADVANRVFQVGVILSIQALVWTRFRLAFATEGCTTTTHCHTGRASESRYQVAVRRCRLATTIVTGSF